MGIVRAVETTSVKITYTLEDNTGCIEGVHWIDGVRNIEVNVLNFILSYLSNKWLCFFVVSSKMKVVKPHNHKL